MTEHHNDSHGAHGGHGHGGGHELDAPPTRELFNIVWGLGALTLLSLITCVQLFNDQARDLNAERGKEGSALLAEYRKGMETRTRGQGEDTLTDATGKVVARYSYIPLASARDLILAKPEKLGAFAPPPGWIHPDDVATGGQKAAAPTPTPAAPEGTPPADGTAPAVPTEGAAAPAEGAAAPAEGAAAPAGTPTDAAKPADAAAKPAEGTPPAALPPGTKDEAMPVNADKGQSESTKPVPGGTPEPVGAKSNPSAPAPAPAH
ncbi:hypothetical protein [Nannocystis punicea]|uniref:Uncharacterized protein n=1 Tax=Nannocystis punicea TaxID=2995304 RepID=A0ABY7GZ15_9BACT|nr:hypothetical protein [Nannocystis poenicansa]WAS92232.1 hypothetical protein O0S08_39125 [Nannocystis poenicansa]